MSFLHGGREGPAWGRGAYAKTGHVLPRGEGACWAWSPSGLERGPALR